MNIINFDWFQPIWFLFNFLLIAVIILFFVRVFKKLRSKREIKVLGVIVMLISLTSCGEDISNASLADLVEKYGLETPRIVTEGDRGLSFQSVEQMDTFIKHLNNVGLNAENIEKYLSENEELLNYNISVNAINTGSNDTLENKVKRLTNHIYQGSHLIEENDKTDIYGSFCKAAFMWGNSICVGLSYDLKTYKTWGANSSLGGQQITISYQHLGGTSWFQTRNTNPEIRGQFSSRIGLSLIYNGVITLYWYAPKNYYFKYYPVSRNGYMATSYAGPYQKVGLP